MVDYSRKPATVEPPKLDALETLYFMLTRCVFSLMRQLRSSCA